MSKFLVLIEDQPCSAWKSHFSIDLSSIFASFTNVCSSCGPVGNFFLDICDLEHFHLFDHDFAVGKTKQLFLHPIFHFASKSSIGTLFEKMLFCFSFFFGVLCISSATLCAHSSNVYRSRLLLLLFIMPLSFSTVTLWYACAQTHTASAHCCCFIGVAPPVL